VLNPCVLDTTVASLLLDRSPLLALYRPYLENASLCLSFQTVAEMRFGALKANWGANRKRSLEQFFTSFQLVVYTDQLSAHWAEIMYVARRAGRRLETGDAWIAATARYLNAPLLAHDKDFSPEACPSIVIFCHA
jgi:tRNA(fMet)-specific endonuclease VapC